MSNKNDVLRRSTLQYHASGRKGKIEVIPSKPCFSQQDLTMAYTPGVAIPCMEIEKDQQTSRLYTAKGNLVAVISNGSAVLGLGNIGALAGKPVMEGKAVLFKQFADIDVFDIEVDSQDADDIIKTVKNIAPTFGGINLEDIKAPECFYIEETLKRELDIPVFHDDQHGTAIISGAALINALEIVDKKPEDVKIVFSGAGAAGIACANFYLSLGADLQNVLMVDSNGVMWKGRGDEDRNPYKKKFFRTTERRTLADAMRGADVFCGVSVKDILTVDMVKTMSDYPIIFAMANPDPEITYDLAKKANPNAIVATGRSDYPNQVNNVLGFPFIFRGALDVNTTAINEEMKLAAAHALADLAKEEVPESVKRAYNNAKLYFGPDYIIPKPFDPRVFVWESVAVAKAAMETGVARKTIDLDRYRKKLMEKVDWSREVMRKVFNIARTDPKRIVFPEGNHPKIIWAATEIVREGIAKPVLLVKDRAEVLKIFKEHNHSHEGIEIIEQKKLPYREELTQAYYKLRQRKGLNKGKAYLRMKNYFYFASMMVKEGYADAMVAGVSVSYPNVLVPALRIAGPKKENQLVGGYYLVQHDHKVYCFSDCAVNINPTAEQLAEITLKSAKELERMHIEPRVAMLSFTNFGAVRTDETNKITRAIEIVQSIQPDLMIDGPIQPDVAFDQKHLENFFPFTNLKKDPTLLIFPNLDAGNISLRMLKKFSNIRTIGPVMFGLEKPIHLLGRDCDVSNIVSMAAIACVEAQDDEEEEVEMNKKPIFSRGIKNG